MKHNLKIIRGDDTTMSVRLVQNDAPLSLSDLERADLHVKVKGKTVISLSTTDGTIEHDDERMLLHFTHDATKRLTFTSADYDLQLIKSAKVKTVMYGRIDLQHDITQL